MDSDIVMRALRLVLIVLVAGAWTMDLVALLSDKWLVHIENRSIIKGIQTLSSLKRHSSGVWVIPPFSDGDRNNIKENMQVDWNLKTEKLWTEGKQRLVCVLLSLSASCAFLASFILSIDFCFHWTRQQRSMANLMHFSFLLLACAAQGFGCYQYRLMFSKIVSDTNSSASSFYIFGNSLVLAVASAVAYSLCWVADVLVLLTEFCHDRSKCHQQKQLKDQVNMKKFSISENNSDEAEILQGNENSASMPVDPLLPATRYHNSYAYCDCGAALNMDVMANNDVIANNLPHQVFPPSVPLINVVESPEKRMEPTRCSPSPLVWSRREDVDEDNYFGEFVQAPALAPTPMSRVNNPINPNMCVFHHYHDYVNQRFH